MGNKKPKNLPNFNPFAIEKKNLQQIQEIAFYNVFDAFEINEALKILQITRQKIETSIIRPAAKKIEPYKKKFTKFKDYFSQQTGKVKSKIILKMLFITKELINSKGANFRFYSQDYYLKNSFRQ